VKYYDVIIVGGGIAGCGLAYNLAKECPDKSVLLIEKDEIGANAAYGYRNTFKEIVKEYNLPYVKMYKGIKIGAENKILAEINCPMYFFDYRKACKHLLDVSSAYVKKECAVHQGSHILTTDTSKYYFDKLVDCSGINFFTKNSANQKRPKYYWKGIVTKTKKPKISNDYYYFYFGDQGHLEEIYPFSNHILYGRWKYVRQKEVNILTNENYYVVQDVSFDDTKICQIPCSPAFPICEKDIICLGDSFGNANCSSASGIGSILDSSNLLANCIKTNSNFEKMWKKKYLNFYLSQLASRKSRYMRNPLLSSFVDYPKNRDILPIFNKYPEVFIDLLKGNFKKPPMEIARKYPMLFKFNTLLNYFLFKMNPSGV